MTLRRSTLKRAEVRALQKAKNKHGSGGSEVHEVSEAPGPMPGRSTLSLLLVALPVSISFVGVGPVRGPTSALRLSPRCAPTRLSTPARSFAPRTFPWRVCGGHVLYASEGDDPAMPGDVGVETAAPSKEAADESGTLTRSTLGMTGALLDYERDATTSSGEGSETAPRKGGAGKIGSQWVFPGERSAAGASWREARAYGSGTQTREDGRARTKKRSEWSAASPEGRVAPGRKPREENLADVVRRGGSIGCGVRAVKRLVRSSFFFFFFFFITLEPRVA